MDLSQPQCVTDPRAGCHSALLTVDVQRKLNDVVLYLTLIAECVDGVVYDAVWAEPLSLGQQTQQRGNLQPHRVICFL